MNNTKGPWKVDAMDPTLVSVKGVMFVVAKVIKLGRSDEEVEANARLIAAAPLMYESLKHMVALLDDENTDMMDFVTKLDGDVRTVLESIEKGTP